MPTYSTGNEGGSGLYGLLADKKADDWKPTVQSRPILSVHPSDDLAGTPGAQESLYLLEGVAMTIPYRIIFAGDETRRAEVEGVLASVFDRVNKVLNNWNADSEIEKALATAATQFGKGAPISQELFDFLKMGEDYVSATGGRFDPTVAPLVKAWRRALETRGQPPAPSETGPLSYALGWKNVTLKADANGGRLLVKNANTRLDLGGYSKGHAVDLIAEELSKAGVKDVMIEWGGDIKAIGKHPTGREWRTAVIRPPPLKPLFKLWNEGNIMQAITPDLLYCTANLSGLAMATSGDYFQIQKFGYHHIMHPGAKQPMRANETGVASVSVVAKSCSAADAYATAAFVCGSLQECNKFLKTLKAEGRIEAYAIFGRKGTPLLEGKMFETSETAVVTDNIEVEVSGAPSKETVASLSDLASLIKTPATNIAFNGSASTVDCSGLDLCSVQPLLVSVLMDNDAIFSQGGADKGIKARIGAPEQKRVIEGAVFSVTAVSSSVSLVVVEVTSVLNVHPMKTGTGEEAADDLKAMMATWPGPGSVVTYRSITGLMHALTASSVRFLAEDGVVLFNVQKGSKAHLGLSGLEGSELAVHLLAAGQEELGRTFARETEIDPEGKNAPSCTKVLLAGDQDRAPRFEGAGRTVVARVERVVDAGDHSFVFARAGEVLGTGQLADVLVWKDRNFVKASSLRG